MRTHLASWLSATAASTPVVVSLPWYAAAVVEAAARRAVHTAGQLVSDAAAAESLEDVRSVTGEQITVIGDALQRLDR